MELEAMAYTENGTWGRGDSKDILDTGKPPTPLTKNPTGPRRSALLFHYRSREADFPTISPNLHDGILHSVFFTC